MRSSRFSLLESRERVLRAHQPRALREERQRRVTREVRVGAQEGSDRLLHVGRGRVARAPLGRNRRLEVRVHRQVGEAVFAPAPPETNRS